MTLCFHLSPSPGSYSPVQLAWAITCPCPSWALPLMSWKGGQKMEALPSPSAFSLCFLGWVRWLCPCSNAGRHREAAEPFIETTSHPTLIIAHACSSGREGWEDAGQEGNGQDSGTDKAGRWEEVSGLDGESWAEQRDSVETEGWDDRGWSYPATSPSTQTLATHHTARWDPGRLSPGSPVPCTWRRYHSGRAPVPCSWRPVHRHRSPRGACSAGPG